MLGNVGIPYPMISISICGVIFHIHLWCEGLWQMRYTLLLRNSLKSNNVATKSILQVLEETCNLSPIMWLKKIKDFSNCVMRSSVLLKSINSMSGHRRCFQFESVLENFIKSIIAARNDLQNS